MRNPRKYTQTLDKHPYANPSNKPAYKSQAAGLTYAKSGGRNLGKSGIPTRGIICTIHGCYPDA